MRPGHRGSGTGSQRPLAAAEQASARSASDRRDRPRHAAGLAFSSGSAIAPATRSSWGTSYQRCGFASLPCMPRTSAIDHARAALARRGVLELRHEGVVAEPVLDHDLRLRDRQARRRAGLEEVGVGVRVREDRRDRDVWAADLRRDVPVDVLRRDDVEPPGRPRGAAARRKERGSKGENDNGSHYHRS